MSVRNVVSIFFILLSCTFSFAQNKEKEFEIGADEENAQKYLSNSPSAIQARMVEEVAKQCNNNGCTIAAMEREDRGWTVAMNIGHGNAMNNSGNTFIIGGPTNTSNNDQNYVGVTVTYRNLKCNTELKLQKEWYLTLTSYGAYARDENNKPVPVAKPDTKFFALVVTELAKQLNQAGCTR